MNRLFTLAATLLVGAVASGCTAQPDVVSAERQAERSILSSSIPVAGSIVSDSIDNLELHFDPPARLEEATVSGPGGTMPMMVHAAGEDARYSLPLSGIGPGRYHVDWRANARGREYRGSFEFTVRN